MPGAETRRQARQVRSETTPVTARTGARGPHRGSPSSAARPRPLRSSAVDQAPVLARAASGGNPPDPQVGAAAHAQVGAVHVRVDRAPGPTAAPGVVGGGERRDRLPARDPVQSSTTTVPTNASTPDRAAVRCTTSQSARHPAVGVGAGQPHPLGGHPGPAGVGQQPQCPAVPGVPHVAAARRLRASSTGTPARRATADRVVGAAVGHHQHPRPRRRPAPAPPPRSAQRGQARRQQLRLVARRHHDTEDVGAAHHSCSAAATDAARRRRPPRPPSSRAASPAPRGRRPGARAAPRAAPRGRRPRSAGSPPPGAASARRPACRPGAPPRAPGPGGAAGRPRRGSSRTSESTRRSTAGSGSCRDGGRASIRT